VNTTNTHVAIISIGAELTTGQTVDANAAWLSRRAAELGLPTDRHLTVSDDRRAIADAVRNCADRAAIVLITGGLGPTADDLTRAALADVIGVELEYRPHLLARVEAFFKARRKTMPERNRVQAMFPVGSDAIENTAGTAPGIAARFSHTRIFAMPGVPREMRVMFDRDIAPVIRPLGGGQCILTSTVYTFGATESGVGQAIADLMARDANPLVGTTAADAVIGVRIIARGESPDAAAAMIAETRAELARRLGPIVFGVDDSRLAVPVAALLTESGATVSTAESCTGGLLAGALTDISGSSAYFLEGHVTYSNAAKSAVLGVPADLIDRHGAVSPHVAESMAAGCRVRAGSAYALSVTGVAGPTGGAPDKPVGLVYIGLAGPNGVDAREYRFGEHLTRAEIRDRSVKAALDRLRRRLMPTNGDNRDRVV
jgi:nicotinamide-nucleotide amidase